MIPLTPREADVAALLALGRQNKVIAHQLGVTKATVDSHMCSILRKLGVSNRTEAALMLKEKQG